MQIRNPFARSKRVREFEIVCCMSPNSSRPLVGGFLFFNSHQKLRSLPWDSESGLFLTPVLVPAMPSRALAHQSMLYQQTQYREILCWPMIITTFYLLLGVYVVEMKNLSGKCITCVSLRTQGTVRRDEPDAMRLH